MKWTIYLVSLMVVLPACTNSRKLFPPYKVKERTMTELEGGVQLYWVREGKGELPVLEDELKVHYQGMLEDGTVFDSSFERDEPAVFPLNRLIRGWQIGMVKVPIGSKVRLVIPPDLAYGDRETGSIPPGSTLTFDIHLLAIED